MNELEINQYKAERESEFYFVFRELEKELSEKYNIKISISVHYNTLMINGINKELTPIINDVRNEIITYAKNKLDDEFLLRVNQNEIQFSKGDTLKAHLQIAQTMTTKGIKNEYTITKILEYRSIKQLKLNY